MTKNRKRVIEHTKYLYTANRSIEHVAVILAAVNVLSVCVGVCITLNKTRDRDLFCHRILNWNIIKTIIPCCAM